MNCDFYGKFRMCGQNWAFIVRAKWHWYLQKLGRGLHPVTMFYQDLEQWFKKRWRTGVWTERSNIRDAERGEGCEHTAYAWWHWDSEQCWAIDSGMCRGILGRALNWVWEHDSSVRARADLDPSRMFPVSIVTSINSLVHQVDLWRSFLCSGSHTLSEWTDICTYTTRKSHRTVTPLEDRGRSCYFRWIIEYLMNIAPVGPLSQHWSSVF